MSFNAIRENKILAKISESTVFRISDVIVLAYTKYQLLNLFYPMGIYRERSGSVVECLTRDRRAAGSSLTGVTALWSLSKTHLS